MFIPVPFAWHRRDWRSQSGQVLREIARGSFEICVATSPLGITMKRVDGLYEQILELDNFLVAFHRAARGKRYRAEVREFQEDFPR